MVRGQPQALGEGGAGVSQPPASLTGESRRSPNVKILLFGFVLLSLLGVLTLAAVREVVTSPAKFGTARPTLAAPRPPLTPAEEAYAGPLADPQRGQGERAQDDPWGPGVQAR